MNFIIIAVLAFLGVFLALKWNNIRTKLAFYLITLGVVFILLIGFFVVSGKNVDMSTVDGVSGAVKTYLSWFSQVGSSVMRVSSYAVNQEWKGDGSNSTEE
ncbi:MAG: hypothetical protein KKB79_00670 [Nanoarchaeota archaeon]|nr:hypothetical protein [Nanoarchaeota archaeon]